MMASSLMKDEAGGQFLTEDLTHAGEVSVGSASRLRSGNVRARFRGCAAAGRAWNRR